MSLQHAMFVAVALTGSSPILAGQAPTPAVYATRSVAPALDRITESILEGELWKRLDLAPRDCSIATVSAMVTTGQTGTLKPELARALDNKIAQAELGALMTHIAFYAGWPNALSAMGVYEGPVRGAWHSDRRDDGRSTRQARNRREGGPATCNQRREGLSMTRP